MEKDKKYLTVGQLIKELSKFDKDLPVLTCYSDHTDHPYHCGITKEDVIKEMGSETDIYNDKTDEWEVGESEEIHINLFESQDVLKF